MTARLARLFREERPATLLGLVRVAVAALLLWNGAKLALRFDRAAYFADYFHLPVLPASLVPSANVYVALLSVKICACLFALLGVVARPSLLVAAVIGLYVIACDRLQYHNNHYVAHLVGFLLAFAPCDRSFLPLRRLRRGPRAAVEPRGPVWAVALIKFQVSLVYLTSATGKLLDADWRGGDVMRLRYLQGVDVIRGRGFDVPDAVRELLGSPLFGSLTSKAAIATELFLAIGLMLPRTRILALWLGVMFHIGIQIFALVDLFSWLMLSVYVLYGTPEIHERILRFDPASPRARRIARLARSLDFLLRYRIEPANADSGVISGSGVNIVDRDGNLVSRGSIFISLCRTLPLLFPLWLPARMIGGVAGGRGRRLASAVSHN